MADKYVINAEASGTQYEINLPIESGSGGDIANTNYFQKKKTEDINSTNPYPHYSFLHEAEITIPSKKAFSLEFNLDDFVLTKNDGSTGPSMFGGKTIVCPDLLSYPTFRHPGDSLVDSIQDNRIRISCNITSIASGQDVCLGNLLYAHIYSSTTPKPDLLVEYGEKGNNSLCSTSNGVISLSIQDYLEITQKYQIISISEHAGGSSGPTTTTDNSGYPIHSKFILAKYSDKSQYLLGGLHYYSNDPIYFWFYNTMNEDCTISDLEFNVYLSATYFQELQYATKSTT